MMIETIRNIPPLAQKGLFWSVALFFLLLPTGTATPLIALGLAVLCRLAAGNWRQIPHIISQPWFWPVIPMVVLPWLGLAYSLNPDLGVDYAMKGKYWLALFVTASLVPDDQQVLVMLSCFWTGLACGALLALAQFLGLAPVIKAGYPGFGVVHTLLSMYLIVGILTAAFYFRHSDSGRIKALLLLLIPLFLFHLAVLKGRSGYLIFILVSPMVARDLLHRFSKKLKWAAALVLVLAIFLSPVARDTVENTIVTLKENKEKAMMGMDIEQMPRFYIMGEALKAVKAHPFLGIGTGSFTELTRPKGHEVAHPHNNFLYMTVSFGIAGFLACAWFFWTLFRLSWKFRHMPLGYVLFCTTLVLFLGGMFDTQLINTGTLMMLSVSCGFLHQLTCQPPMEPV